MNLFIPIRPYKYQHLPPPTLFPNPTYPTLDPHPQNIVAASSKISEQEALFHARLTPITDRLVGMAFPDPLDAVARLIAGRYQVGVSVRVCCA